MGSNWQGVDAGLQHGFSLQGTHSIWASGFNLDGQLGLGVETCNPNWKLL
jgi:alpha-tubulin suppressor-like RCC1 family protein